MLGYNVRKCIVIIKSKKTIDLLQKIFFITYLSHDLPKKITKMHIFEEINYAVYKLF